RDRPAVLSRCVQRALQRLGSSDCLTVIDDSCDADCISNMAILRIAAATTSARMIHCRANSLQSTVAQASHRRRLSWQLRTAARDIAPLRNLSLLVASVVRAETTILIDDDICEFDLDATHQSLTSSGYECNGTVVGARICGTSELDTVTRLGHALQRLK